MKKLISSFANTLLYAIAFALVPMACGASPVSSVVGSYIFVEAVSFAVPKLVIGADVYSDTVLQAARAFIKDENNKKFELRPNFTNILGMFMKDREFSLPNLAELRAATTRTTTAMYLKKKTFTVGSSKSCSPSGQQSGSDSVDLSWAMKNVVITTNFKQHAGNEVSQARAFANDLYNAEVSLWESVDSALLTYLEANKSAVNNGGSGEFDSDNDIMWVANTNVDDFYNLLTSDMKLNNYNPTYLEAFNTMWEAKQRKYINQGAGNNQNTAFQFAGFEFFPSNLISGTPTIGGNTYTSIHYVVPQNGVAILDWNDPLNRAGKVSGEKSWSTYQSILRPEFTFDLFKVSSCGDTTSSGGGTQDFTETWELTLNYALAKQPVPTADETPIYKYGIADDNTYVS